MLSLAVLLIAAPVVAEGEVAAEGDQAVDQALPAPEQPALVNAGPNPPMEIGLELGEPTGLIFAKTLNSAGRLTARLGLLHRLEPYGFGLEAPLLGAGYEHDVLQVPIPGWQAHVTAGAGAMLWLRGSVHRTKPLAALEGRIGLRLRRPESPLIIAAHIAPQLDIMPYVTPAIVGGLSFSWALDPSTRTAAPAEEPTEEEAQAEVKPEPKKAEKSPAKRRSKKRR